MSALGPDARALLDSVRDGDDPSAADAARVRARIAAHLAGAVATGTVAAAATKTAVATGSVAPPSLAGAGVGASGGAAALASGGAASSLGAKVLVAIALAGGTSLAGAALHRSHAPSVESIPATTAGAPMNANAPRASSSSTESRPPKPPSSAEPATPPATPHSPATASAVLVRPSGISTRPRTVDRSSSDGFARTRERTPSARRPVPAVDASAGSIAIAPEHIEREASQEGLPAGPPSPLTPDAVAEEAALLRSAQAALAGGDGATALARLDEHAVRFPHGALEEERLAARVFALCASGRAAEARAAASAFVAASPRSPLAAQVRRTCATDVRDTTQP